MTGIRIAVVDVQFSTKVGVVYLVGVGDMANGTLLSPSGLEVGLVDAGCGFLIMDCATMVDELRFIFVPHL